MRRKNDPEHKWSAYEYRAWRNALYSDSGVVPEWSTFHAFLQDMPTWEDGLALFRRDKKLPFGPSNCGWATLSQVRSHKIPRR